MLPSRRYTPSAILWILRKRKWLMIGPFIMFSATAIWLAVQLPDRYRAQTLIQVVPQRVPENYVRPVIAESINQRLLSISPEILSETRLERIITELDLYPEARVKRGGMQAVINDMRDEIDVEIIKGDLFRVTFSGDSPFKVMQVTERLASLFVEENLKDRAQLARGTNEFLETQLREVEARLQEQERKVQEYRQRHAGALPSQIGANLQVLQNTGLQLQSLEDSLGRDRDRRLELEHILLELEKADASAASARLAATAAAEQTEASASASVSSNGIPELAPASATRAAQLRAARQRLEVLRLRFTADHPDVLRTTRLITEIERAATAELVATSGAGATITTDPAALTRMAQTNQVRAQLGALDKEMARKLGEQAKLKAILSTYQSRVDSEPERESELIGLTRDYETLKGSYQSLLAKKEESTIASNLEREQVSQQFKTLDPARVPAQPYSPDRRLIIMVAAAIGLGLGFGLTCVLELRDQSFRLAPEIVEVLSLPVLAMVPAMVTRHEQKQLNRRLALSLGVVFLAVLAGGGFYAFRYGLW